MKNPSWEWEKQEKRKEYVELLKNSIEKVIAELQNKVEKISIFGSYPRRRSDLFSDLDILILMKTDKPFLERLKEIYSLLALPVDADIFCYTPEEFDRLRSKGFFKRMMEEEIVVYEKGSD